MSTAKERRIAYAVAAERIRHDCPADFGGIDTRLTLGVVTTLEAMVKQLEAAAAQEDVAGVEGHVSGTGMVAEPAKKAAKR